MQFTYLANLFEKNSQYISNRLALSTFLILKFDLRLQGKIIEGPNKIL